MRPHRPVHHHLRRRGIAIRRKSEARADLPAPQGVDEWVVLTVNDAERVLALLERSEEHDKAPYRSSRDDVLELFDPGILHASHGAVDSSGNLVAFGMVRVLADGDVTDARCSGAVLPEWRDMRIGSAIVEWQLATGRKLLDALEVNGPRRISRFCEGTATDEIDLLERVGFTERSAFTQMRRDLSGDLQIPEMSQHLRIEPWGAEWSAMIREASVEPEALTEDGRGLSEEDWERMHLNLVPEWSCVVIDRSTDRSRVAGYIMAARWEDDWQALGWSEGYINALGIFSPWRKQRVGQALMTNAMRKMRADGMQFAGIDIDSEDVSGTSALCEVLGFEPTHRTSMFAIDL